MVPSECSILLTGLPLSSKLVLGHLIFYCEQELCLRWNRDVTILGHTYFFAFEMKRFMEQYCLGEGC